MRKFIEKIFCALLAIATGGHLFGTFKFFTFGTPIFVWSLSGALASGLLVWINFLRSSRPGDRSLRSLALVGNVGWLVIVLLFGQAIGNYFDPRVLFHALTTLGLIYFCLR